jgi:hypothetical protein
MLTFWNPVVTFCTTMFSIQKFYLYLYSAIMCFVWMMEQTEIISLAGLTSVFL